MKKHLTLAVALLTIVCAAVHAQLPSYLPADGLVGWWPFNGNANDESGNGNHGVVNGAVLTEDRFGSSEKAYYFSGISCATRIDFDLTQPTIETGITISLWIKRVGNGCLAPRIFEFYPNGPQVEITNAGSLDYFNSLINSEWNFIVYKIDNDSVWTFLNGNLDSSGLRNQTYPVSSDFSLGRMNHPSYDAFNGNIDDLGIWNRALTEQEIQNLYTGSTPSACIDLPANLQDGLVGYWPFCGNANDESGNGNNGTVNGATLAADRFGNAGSAYNFDGVDDFVVTQLSGLMNNQNLTLCYWMNYNDEATASWPYRYALFKGIAGESNDFASRINPINQSEFIVYNSGSGFPVNIDFVLQQNEWMNIVNVYNDGISTIFINGIVVAQQSSPFSPNITNYPLYIGNGHTLGYYSGLLDEITIYNRALSPEEITQLYAVQSTGDPTAGGGGNGGSASGVPRGISYQAVARDAQGQAIVSSPVNVRFTLHQSTPTGTTEYSETHALTTNEIGLFSTYFGSGTAITAAFDSIVWSNSTKFLQVEIDLGNGYVDMGTQQLMSVPYALRSAESARIKNAALPIFSDNASALAGGLVAGEMYRTATGDLKVVY